jgi:hypothetical protein
LSCCVLERNPLQGTFLMDRFSVPIEFTVIDRDFVVANPASESSQRCHGVGLPSGYDISTHFSRKVKKARGFSHSSQDSR